MPRGGRRPGAGAPLGNTNALKTGTHSLRVRAIITALMRDAEARKILLRLGSSTRTRNQYARHLAMAMARFMHDHPVAAEARRQIDEIADRGTIEFEMRRLLTQVAQYEQQNGRDAETGERLTRYARQTPEQQDRIARVVARLRAARAEAELMQYIESPEPDREFVPILDELEARNEP